MLTSGQVPITYGSGGTEDPGVIANRDQMVLYSQPPVVRTVVEWSGSGLLTCRIVAHQFFSFEIKAPKRISCLSGFGFGTPTFP